jgi:hypothetical protein
MRRTGVAAVAAVLTLGLSLALAISLIGSGNPIATPAGSAGAVVTRALPTLPGPPVMGAPQACAGVGLAAVLHGDPSDQRVAWLENLVDGSRLDVLWPAGYRARFAPSLEVLDASGATVAREGDAIEGACVVGDDQLEVAPEPPMFAVDCGPIPVMECVGGNLTFQVRESLRALFPGRDPDVVRFTATDGAFVVRFEDGGRDEGHVRPGG